MKTTNQLKHRESLNCGYWQRFLFSQPAGKKNMAGLPDEGKKPGH
jgi:hypothetical protein